MEIKDFMEVFREEFENGLKSSDFKQWTTKGMMKIFEESGMRAVVKFYQNKNYRTALNVPSRDEFVIPSLEKMKGLLESDDKSNDPKG